MLRSRTLALGLCASLVAATGLMTLGPAVAVVEDPVPVAADVETAPVPSAGDAADDPAIWVHPTDRAKSLLIGNDKLGGLDTYDLQGTRHQRITAATTFWGNVDVRQQVNVDGTVVDVVAAYNGGLRMLTVDVPTRDLVPITEGTGTIPTGGGEGLCLYSSPTTGVLSAFVITIAGHVRQLAIDDVDHDGLLNATVTREFDVGSEAEGCVADDVSGALYVSEEDVGLWRYGAEPGSGTARTSVDTVQPSGHLTADVEGLTIADLGGGAGYLIASAQNVANPSQSYFVVYDRVTNAYVRSFRIVDGTSADGCQRTDGIVAYAGNLGPQFPSGAFVCQDDSNVAPGSTGNQDFKLTRLEKVIDLDPPDPQPSPVSFVGAQSSNGNRTAHSVGVPASVQPGDTLLLFLTGNLGTVAVTPPAGWAPVQEANDSAVVTRLWWRTAGPGDAGTSVGATTSAYVKSNVTVAAYRSTAPNAIAASRSAIDTVVQATHTTPSVEVTEAGSWLVSYWSDKSSSTTSWTAPAGQSARSSSFGTGGGRVSGLLADSGAAVPVGTSASLAATANSPSSRAATMSVVLRPAATTPPANEPPTADATASCVLLVCQFDASASDDPDGTVDAYDWDFGDGTSGTGMTPSHTYAGPGARTVTLTVTDDDDATASTTVQVAPVAASVSFVDAASTNGNRLLHTVRVPTTARAGDTLVLVFTGNSSTTTPAAPAGWTSVTSATYGGIAGRVWTKPAVAADVGSNVSVTTSAYVKSDLSVAAYRGASGVQASTAGVDPLVRATHTSPAVDVTAPGSWLVTYWADKSSATTTWTSTAGQAVRTGSTGSGGGHVTAVLTDSGGALAPGTRGGLTATTDANSSSTFMATLVLAPA